MPGGAHRQKPTRLWLPGRTVARIGLRMMPPFPPSSLSSRTVSFPSVRLEGWHFKQRLSPTSHRLSCTKPAQRDRKFASASSCTPQPHLMSGTVSERWARWRTAIRGDQPLYPRGPRSGPSYSVSVHLHLSTSCAPLLGTSRFHGIAAYTGCPRCAGAPRRRKSGSVLSLRAPSRHAAL